MELTDIEKMAMENNGSDENRIILLLIEKIKEMECQIEKNEHDITVGSARSGVRISSAEDIHH